MGWAKDNDISDQIAGVSFDSLFQTAEPTSCFAAGFRLINVGDSGPQCVKPKVGAEILASRLETRQVNLSL